MFKNETIDLFILEFEKPNYDNKLVGRTGKKNFNS